MSEIINFVPVLMIMITALGLLLNIPWRWMVIVLSIQYVAVFWLVSQNLSLGLSAVKLLVGWMAGAVLGSSFTDVEDVKFISLKLSDNIFKIIAGLLILLLAFSLGNTAFYWIPASIPVLSGGLVLIGLGLLQLGMSTHPFRTTIGLLTLLSGFDVIYAAVVSSVLVTGLLALVTLGLAFSGAYLMNVAHLEESR